MLTGEGELKILSWLNEFILFNNAARNEKIAVCGCDADILLQCMIHPLYRQIFVVEPRKTNTVPKGSTECCDVGQLVHSIMSSHHFPLNSVDIPVEIRLDLAFLCILRGGNDYLPKLSGCSSISTSEMDSYAKVYINFKLLGLFLLTLLLIRSSFEGLIMKRY